MLVTAERVSRVHRPDEERCVVAVEAGAGARAWTMAGRDEVRWQRGGRNHHQHGSCKIKGKQGWCGSTVGRGCGLMPWVGDCSR